MKYIKSAKYAKHLTNIFKGVFTQKKMEKSIAIGIPLILNSFNISPVEQVSKIQQSFPILYLVSS